MCVCIRCVFFFQAEDGIRDVAVTGVQTCALPICPTRTRGRHRRRHASERRNAHATRDRALRAREAARAPGPKPSLTFSYLPLPRIGRTTPERTSSQPLDGRPPPGVDIVATPPSPPTGRWHRLR